MTAPNDDDDIRETIRRHMEQEDEWRPAIEKKLDDHHRILVGDDDTPGIAPIVREMHKILTGSRFTMKVLIWIASCVAGLAAFKTWWSANISMTIK